MDNKFGPYTFKSEYDKKVAKLFFDEGSNFLFALAVDYPGLYKIPLEYCERARLELRSLGYKVYNGDYRQMRQPENYPRTYRIYYLGPRGVQGAYGYRPSSTPKKLATSFKIYFYRSGVK